VGEGVPRWAEFKAGGPYEVFFSFLYFLFSLPFRFLNSNLNSIVTVHLYLFSMYQLNPDMEGLIILYIIF
jgi:hypothetical protein